MILLVLYLSYIKLIKGLSLREHHFRCLRQIWRILGVHKALFVDQIVLIWRLIINTNPFNVFFSYYLFLWLQLKVFNWRIQATQPILLLINIEGWCLSSLILAPCLLCLEDLMLLLKLKLMKRWLLDRGHFYGCHTIRVFNIILKEISLTIELKSFHVVMR